MAHLEENLATAEVALDAQDVEALSAVQHAGNPLHSG